MHESSVYLHRSLWHVISRYADRAPCRRCSAPADFAQAQLRQGPPGRPFGGYFTRASSYCEPHLAPVLRRRALPVIRTEAEAVAFAQAQTKRTVALVEAQRRELSEREAYVLATAGRVLRLSGRDGGLYQRADGVLVAVLNDGSERVVCCWLEGCRRVGKRLPSHLAQSHNDDCDVTG